MGALTSFAAKVGWQRLLIMAGVGAALIAGLVALSMRVNAPTLGYLFTDMEPAQAQAVVEKLTALNVPYKLSADGGSIMAPQDKIPSLRMQMAAADLGGPVGYELLDKQDALGTTSFLQNVNHIRAIEGELSRTIASLNAVRDARVHLTIPERQLFDKDVRKPSASIKLTTQSKLTAQQVNAIRSLVASAVSGLEPGHISIIDQTGALLAKADTGDGSDVVDGVDDRRQQLEQKLRSEIETMLERIVGPGKVRAEVAAELDMEQVRQEAEVYDPDRQVVARSTTVERADASTDGQTSNQVTVANNLPGQQPATPPGDSSKANSNETSEQVDYANSKTVTTTIRSSGAVRRLSVAVLIDGAYTDAADGKQNYTPRTAAELAQFTRLVQSAIGYSQQRGDSVVVENLRFMVEKEPEGVLDGAFALGLEKEDVISLAELLVMGLLGVLALFLIVRPILKRAAAVQADVDAAAVTAMLGAPEERLGLPAPERSEITAQLIERAAAGDEEALKLLQDERDRNDGRLPVEHEIDVAQIDGKVKASALKKVGEVVKRHPAESVAIIRQWMYS